MRRPLIFSAFALAFALGTAHAQTAQLPTPPPVERAIAARASDTTEVTLDKQRLAFAAHFLDKRNGKDEHDATSFIEGLDGIYVREYTFDKDNAYSPAELDELRKYFTTENWSPIVREHSRHDGENTDVYMKLVNGESHGIFVLTAAPKELTLVMILGPIKMDDLSKLHSIGGLDKLGNIGKDGKGAK